MKLSHEGKGTVEYLSDEVSTASLFFSKTERRYNKGRQFNGFVLHQKSATENEFIQFLDHIKENVNEFPGKVRLQIAVLTSYVDEFEQKIFIETQKKPPLEVSHWTAVDVFIEHGQIKTFVLDAVNSFGHHGIYSRLKAIFPAGIHYIFQADSIPNPKKPAKQKFRTIQSDDDSCRIFTIAHLKQLSQIDPEKLYTELKQAAVKGAVYPERFAYGFEVNRIFRFTQSWVTLSSLPAILFTPLKDHKTVGDYAYEDSELTGSETKKNFAIVNKKMKYDQLDLNYYNSLTEDVQLMLLEHKNGLTFLKNPILFDLQAEIAKMPQLEFVNLIKILNKNLDKSAKLLSFSEKTIINQFLEKMNTLIASENLSKSKNEFILRLASFFKLVDKSDLQIIFKNSLCRSIVKFKINNAVKDLRHLINLIAKKNTQAPAARRILITEEARRFRRKLKQDLFMFFGSPQEKTENHESFAAAYRLAKHKIRKIKVACLADMYKFRISSIEELTASSPVDKLALDIKKTYSLFQPTESGSPSLPSALSDSGSGDEMSPKLVSEESIAECRKLAERFSISPLQVALTKKLLQVALYFLAELINKGGMPVITNVNIQDASGRTLLIHAIQTNQSFAVISALINEYKADVNLKDSQEKLPLEYALEAGASLDVMKLIVTNTEGDHVDPNLEERLEAYMQLLHPSASALSISESYSDLDTENYSFS